MITQRGQMILGLTVALSVMCLFGIRALQTMRQSSVRSVSRSLASQSATRVSTNLTARKAQEIRNRVELTDGVTKAAYSAEMDEIATDYQCAHPWGPVQHEVIDGQTFKYQCLSIPATLPASGKRDFLIVSTHADGTGRSITYVQNQSNPIAVPEPNITITANGVSGISISPTMLRQPSPGPPQMQTIAI